MERRDKKLIMEKRFEQKTVYGAKRTKLSINKGGYKTEYGAGRRTNKVWGKREKA